MEFKNYFSLYSESEHAEWYKIVQRTDVSLFLFINFKSDVDFFIFWSDSIVLLINMITVMISTFDWKHIL